jgi:hypothetical protein
MSKKKLIAIFLPALFVMNSLVEVRAKNTERLELSGTIVGFDFLSSVINLYEPFDSPTHRLILLVRVDKLSKGQEQSRYLLVHYKYWYYEKIRLSEAIRSGVEQWRVKLTREAKCDAKLRDILYTNVKTENGTKLSPQPRLIRTSGGHDEDFPLDTTMPCYVTDAGKFNPPK